jgi:hypothetical protein
MFLIFFYFKKLNYHFSPYLLGVGEWIMTKLLWVGILTWLLSRERKNKSGNAYPPARSSGFAIIRVRSHR